MQKSQTGRDDEECLGGVFAAKGHELPIITYGSAFLLVPRTVVFIGKWQRQTRVLRPCEGG